MVSQVTDEKDSQLFLALYFLILVWGSAEFLDGLADWLSWG